MSPLHVQGVPDNLVRLNSFRRGRKIARHPHNLSDEVTIRVRRVKRYRALSSR